MKLKVAKKWKWLARNRDGAWLLYADVPITGDIDWYANELAYVDNVFDIPTNVVWYASLHKRKGDEWVRVES